MEEIECRVCRSGAEEGRPLCKPCLCSGSIQFVHQDCLEAWLTHSGKDTCELCSTKYKFSPLYSPDAPTYVPPALLVTSSLKIIVTKYIPIVLRIVIAACIWLVVAPLWTTRIYQTALRKSPFIMNINLKELTAGIVLIGVAVMSLIILMSFVDFVRVHWAPPARPNPNAEAAPVPGAPDIGHAIHALRPEQQNPERPRVPWLDVDDNGNHMRRRRNMNNRDNQHAARAEDNNGNERAPIDEDVVNIEVVDQPALPLHRDDDTVWEDLADGENDMNQEGQEHDHDDDINMQPARLIDGEAIFNIEINPEQVEEEDRVDEQDPDNHNVDIDRIEDEILEGEFEEADDLAGGVPDDAQNGAGVRAENEMNANNNNNNNNGNEARRRRRNGGGDIDIRIQMDELLGIRGPIRHLIRNAVWLMAFTALYIAVMVTGPCILGETTLNLAIAMLPAAFVEFVGKSVIPTRVSALYSEVDYILIKNQAIMRYSDIFKIVVGYFVISLGMLVVQYYIVRALSFGITLISQIRRSRRVEGAAAAPADAAGGAHDYERLVRILTVNSVDISKVAKLSILLGLRIFLLPVFLGSLIILCTNVFWKASMSQWADFLAENVVGSLAMGWVVGISYMLIITLTVLQLREILHPDILGQVIRPQEGNLDLLNSLINESSFTHIRRICASLCVYMLLLMVLVYAPLRLSLFVLPQEFSTSFHLWYYNSELQLPLELVIGHVGFLSMLDKRKSIIGKMLHKWLLFICRPLRLSRFLLPLRLRRNNLLKPLTRPPVGWDARTNRNTSRWAWRGDQKCALELTVLPRKVPSFWRLRLAVLVVLTWSILAFAMITAAFVPITVGRMMMPLLHVPDWLMHDPLNVLIGCITCAMIFGALQKILSVKLSDCGRIMAQVPFKLGAQVAALGALWLLFEASVGAAVQFMLSPGEDVAALDVSCVTLMALIVTWLKGSVIVGIVGSFVLVGGLEFVLRAVGLGGQFGLVEWTGHMRTISTETTAAVRANNWTEEGLHVNEFRRSILQIIWAWVCALAVSFSCGVVVVFGFQTHFQFLSEQIWCLQWACVIVLTFSALVHPISVVCKLFYNTIRDENYLVGRKLQNDPAHHN